MLGEKSLSGIAKPSQPRWSLLGHTAGAVPQKAAAFIYRARKDLGAVALFLALTLIVTYPLIVQLTSHIQYCCDTWMYYWYMWWTKEALVSPHFDQFYTNFLYYPIGARLSFEALYNSIVGAALWPIFGGVLSFNLLFLSSYVLGAAGAYLLVLRLTGDRKAGIVAGVIFVFSPVRNQYIQFPNISIIQWIPFLALWGIKMVDEPSIRKGVVTGAFFLLVVLSSGYFAVSSVFMLGVIFLWNIRKTLSPVFARAFGAFAVTSLVLVLPFVHAALRDAVSDSFSYYALENRQLAPQFAADVFSFVVPPVSNPLYAEYVSHIYGHFKTHFTEWESYLGVITVALMLLGTFKFQFRNTGLWLVMFFLFVIISLGPYLQVMGKEFQDVRLPFFYLRELPVIESMRSSKRFLVTAMLAASVIAGFGAHYLLTQRIFSREFMGRWLGVGVMGLLVGLILMDYWGWPRTMVTSDASYPIFLEKMAREDGDIVVLSIPIGDSIAMYHQTIHGKRMVGGYIERASPAAMERVNQNRFLNSIDLWRHSEVKTKITPAEERAALELFARYPELKYVIYMKRLFVQPDFRLFEIYRPWLENNFGPLVYEDDLVAVYRARAHYGR